MRGEKSTSRSGSGSARKPRRPGFLAGDGKEEAGGGVGRTGTEEAGRRRKAPAGSRVRAGVGGVPRTAATGERRWRPAGARSAAGGRGRRRRGAREGTGGGWRTGREGPTRALRAASGGWRRRDTWRRRIGRGRWRACPAAGRRFVRRAEEEEARVWTRNFGGGGVYIGIGS